MGPDLQALVAMMKDKYGLGCGDIQGLLDEAFGISLSRGGAAHVVLRVAERSEAARLRINYNSRENRFVGHAWCLIRSGQKPEETLQP